MLLAPRKGLVALGALTAVGGFACSKDYDAFLQGGATTTTTTGAGGTGTGGTTSGGGGTGGILEGGGGAGGSLPPALWAESITGVMPGGAAAFSVAADADGNVLVTGQGASPIDLDGKPVAACAGTSAFVAKIAPSGLPLWRKCFPATKGSAGQEITVDSEGNAYVAGTFNGSITLGADTYLAGSVDAFVVKLDPAGNPAWSKWLEGSGSTWISGIATAGDAVVVTGALTQSFKIESTTLEAAGAAQLYVARLAAGNGALVWAEGFGDAGNDAGPLPTVTGKALTGRVAVSPALDVYVVASFSQDFYLPDAVTLIGHSGGSQFDTYLLHLDPAGAVLHHRFWGNNGKEEQGRAVAVDPASGHVFVTGIFEDPISFDGNTLTPDGQDAYLVELASDLTYQWATSIGGADVQDAFAVAVDGTSVLVAGKFKNTLTLGAGPTYPVGAGEDGYVARFEAGTTNAAATLIGPGGNERAFGVAFSTDAVATAGSFEKTVTIGGKDLTSPAAAAGFVARIATP